MRRFLSGALLVSLVSLPLACGDDDGGTGLPDDSPQLQELAECLGRDLMRVGLAIEAATILFYRLEPGLPIRPAPGFLYREDDGSFSYNRVLGDGLGFSTTLNGRVFPLEVVEDGLQQHDVFNVIWSTREHGEFSDSAAGSLRVVHLGLTSLPDQTEALRILPAGGIWCERDGGCRTEFTQFELGVRHLLEEEQLRSATMTFRTFAAGDTLNGYLASSDPDSIATITGSFAGASYTCIVDLETYDVDCSGN